MSALSACVMCAVDSVCYCRRVIIVCVIIILYLVYSLWGRFDLDMQTLAKCPILCQVMHSLPLAGHVIRWG